MEGFLYATSFKRLEPCGWGAHGFPFLLNLFGLGGVYPISYYEILIYRGSPNKQVVVKITFHEFMDMMIKGKTRVGESWRLGKVIL
jgi:hypothetical protein